MPFCPNCGKEYTSGQTAACSSCGNDLSAYEQPVAAVQSAFVPDAHPQPVIAAPAVLPTSDREILRRFARSALVTVTAIFLAVGVLAGLVSCVFGFIGPEIAAAEDIDLEIVEDLFEYTDDEIDKFAVESFVHELEDYLAVAETYSADVRQAVSLLQVRPPVFELLLLTGLLMFVFSARRENGAVKGIGLMRVSANLAYILIWLLFAVMLCGVIVAVPWVTDKLVAGFYGVFSAASSDIFLIIVIALALVLLVVVALVGIFTTVIGAKASKMLCTWKNAANGAGELIAPVSLQVLLIIMAVLMVEDAFMAVQMGLMTAAAVSVLKIAVLFLFAFCVGKLRKMKVRAAKEAAAAMQQPAPAPIPVCCAVSAAVPAEYTDEPAAQIPVPVPVEEQAKPVEAEEQRLENSEV